MNLTFKQFCELAKRHNVIPLHASLAADLDTPVSAFMKIKKGHFNFLFESVVGGEKWARYSFLGTGTREVYEFDASSVADPMAALRTRVKNYNAYSDPDLPRFYGGLVGYMGYDMVHVFDKIPLKSKRDKTIPDMLFMLTDVVVIFDNFKQVMRVVKTAIIDKKNPNKTELKKIYDAGCRDVMQTLVQLKRPLKKQSVISKKSKVSIKALQTKSDYLQEVAKAKEYIAAGDVFQVVLSTPFVLTRAKLSPLNVYRELRRLNPSPYMFYIETKNAVLVGASPEILVRLEDGKITVRPIAGTRPRGKDDDDDKRLEAELKSDPKERAEHLMLVDLGRNDVGRVAKTGTVRVEQNEVIERYSHVMHLVSHVTGALDPRHDVFDVIQAAFPAGTLSGAPKIRAMQIIDELEPTARGLYGGAVGYISFTHNTDLAIAIRSAVVQKDKIMIRAGAGIVYNSDPQKEYEECQNKAKSMMEAVKRA